MKATEPIPYESSMEVNFEDNMEVIFKKYYKLVCSSIYRMIPDSNLAEDLAQDVFCDLWNKRAHLKITTSLKAYLSKSAVNKTLNHIRKKKIVSGEYDMNILENIHVAKLNDPLEYAELQDYINCAINKLPSKRRIVFMLSRFEEYSYKEISEELGISTKTVENQISKALKALRKAMKCYEEQTGNASSMQEFQSLAC